MNGLEPRLQALEREVLELKLRQRTAAHIFAILLRSQPKAGRAELRRKILDGSIKRLIPGVDDFKGLDDTLRDVLLLLGSED